MTGIECALQGRLGRAAERRLRAAGLNHTKVQQWAVEKLGEGPGEAATSAGDAGDVLTRISHRG